MKFDQWWDFDGEGAAYPKSTAEPLSPVPDGTHVGKVTKVEVKDLKFKSCDANPDGTSFVIAVEVSGHQPLEAILPVHWRGLVEAACRSASVPVPVKGEDWDPKCLVGQYVTVETVQGVGKSGREYVRIERWKPGKEPLPEKVAKQPKAKPPAKPVVEAELDDIPF